jgi:hypothetical protein
MNIDEARLELIRMIQSAALPTTTATVEAVNKSNKTITVKLTKDDTVISGVRLCATVGDIKGIVVVPAIGSVVTVCALDHQQTALQVIGYNQISEVLIDAPQITFNGGLQGGLVLVNQLKADLTLVNAFIQAFQAILLALPITGTPIDGQVLAAALKALPSLPLPTYASIENTKIKQ